MQRLVLLVSIMICFGGSLMSQNVGINTAIPHPNAILDVKGVNKGLLIPRGDSATRTSLSTNSAKGLMLCDTTSNTIWMHNGNGMMSGWQSLSTGTNHWTLSGALGTEIRNTNGGGFWSANASTVLSDPGSLAPPVNGSGTRLIWMPQKSAFRVGTVANDNWNADSLGTWSFATGFDTKSKGPFSFATGYASRAVGVTSTAMGFNTYAGGENAIATGSGSSASGAVATASGLLTAASGYASTASGTLTAASGSFSTAMGNTTIASQVNATAFGNGTTASGVTSTALGYGTNASGENAIAMGSVSVASGSVSTAMGYLTRASATSSTAMGYSTIAMGENAIAMGSVTRASGNNSTSMGFDTYARSYGSVAMGQWNDSVALSSRASWLGTDPLLILGNGVSASNRHNALVVYKNGNVVFKNPTPVLVDPGAIPVPISGAGTRMMWMPEKSVFRVGTVENERWDASSIGMYSFASGLNTRASGNESTAMGSSTSAVGYGAFAIGFGSVASGGLSTATGFATLASGEQSLSTGLATKAQGQASTAMGNSTTASGNSSTAMGNNTEASGAYSTTMGLHNIARGYASTVVGRYCDPILASGQTEITFDTPLFLIGSGFGPSEAERRNAMIVTAEGYVGVGTNTPFTIMDIDAGQGSLNRGFVVRGQEYIASSTIDLGAGSRMTYFPGKGVFRAGVVHGTQWDNVNSGPASAAFGLNTIASGHRSFAAGDNAVASGTGSFALGYYCNALGGNSFAVGSFTKAEGSVSSVMGAGTIAKSALEMVIGQYNDTLLLTSPDPLAWDPNDALFVAGNGTSPYLGARHNAFVIYKNGNTDINGNVIVQDTAKMRGFTELGEEAPGIKMKKLTGVSSGSQNNWTNVAHGLDRSQIISVNVIMHIPTFVNLPPSYTYHAGYEYHFQISNDHIVVINSNGNSGNILTQAFTVLITYEE